MENHEGNIVSTKNGVRGRMHEHETVFHDTVTVVHWLFLIIKEKCLNAPSQNQCYPCWNA